MVYLPIVLVVYLQASFVFTNLCVLEPLVTISQPLCVRNSNCSNKKTRKTRSPEYNAEDIIPLVPLGSPSSGHFLSVKGDDEDYFVSERILPRFGSSNAVILNKEIKPQTECKENIKYRTIDGSCNNLHHPEWGMSKSPFLRILYPRYSNKTPEGLAVSVSGNALPLPRTLSSTLFPNNYYYWKNHTLAVMQWGQLIAHDVGLSPSSTDLNIDCCAAKTNVGQCAPIKIEKNDTFYSQFNQTCMNMIRTKSVLQTAYDCTEIPYQINDVTHYIDLSHLYGADSVTESSLRQFEGGLLEVHLSHSREFPKLSDNPEFDCNSQYANITCFHSGDNRVNQNTQLTCLQTVLLREHNRIAKNLANLNSNWTDEQLFQETRNILIATFQHISYKEWMPLILGDAYMTKHQLKPLTNGFTNYRSNVNVGTINSFMTAAYRIFHSMIQGTLNMYTQNKCPIKNRNINAGRCPFKSINISDYMNLPGIIVGENNFDSLLLGLTVEPPRKLDRYFTSQMTEMMFHGDFPFGEDLESFDIQRGRDHGIPSYNVFRELCNLTRVKTFTELQDEISIKNIKLLESVYEHVEDIDFFVGAVMENWAPGTSVGPTALCIIGEQFVRKKFGDRFWYEAGNQTNSFTEEQLKEIRKCTFSRLLCDNGDNITTIQPNSFLSSSMKGNEIVDCNSIPSLNLTKWKEY